MTAMFKRCNPRIVGSTRRYEAGDAVREEVEAAGCYIERGAVEQARAVASASGDRLGRLVQILHDHGYLTADDVLQLLDSFELVP